MVILKNANYTQFLAETQAKRIICYGAGGTFNDFIRLNRAHISVLETIDYILESEKEKSGKQISIGTQSIPIMTVSEFCVLGIDLIDYVIILCVSEKNTMAVVKTLDEIREFENVICYLGFTALSWGKDVFVPPLSTKENLPTSDIRYEIPKKIHYIWFGDKPLGSVEQDCIESWKKHCGDYEIILWNEANYDIADKPIYVRQAYEAKKYAFASDFARLDIVYKYGGFYLDTDVLLLRSLDDFIKYKAVFGYLPYNEINTGLGFGSIPGNKDIRNQMKIYENVLFINDDEMNLTPCPEYSTEYFRQVGLDIDNRLQLVDNTLFLPSDFLCSLMPIMCENGFYHLPLFALTENSYAIHLCRSSWFEKEMYNAFDNAKTNFYEINKRLLADWQRSYINE